MSESFITTTVSLVYHYQKCLDQTIKRLVECRKDDRKELRVKSFCEALAATEAGPRAVAIARLLAGISDPTPYLDGDRSLVHEQVSMYRDR